MSLIIYVNYSNFTLNTNVSLNSGFSVFRCTFVSNFFFLSGSRYTLTYGSDVPPMSSAGNSSALITVTCKLLLLKSYSNCYQIRLIKEKCVSINVKLFDYDRICTLYCNFPNFCSLCLLPSSSCSSALSVSSSISG